VQFVGTIVLGPPLWWASSSNGGPSAESSDDDSSSANKSGSGGAANKSGGGSSSSSGGAMATNSAATATGASNGAVSGGGTSGGARSKETFATGAAIAGLALPGTQNFGVGCAPYSVEAGYAPLPPPKFNPDQLGFDEDKRNPLSLPSSSSSSAAMVPYGDPQLFLQYNDLEAHRDA